MQGTSSAEPREDLSGDVYFEFNFFDGVMVDCKKVNNSKVGARHSHSNRNPNLQDGVALDDHLRTGRGLEASSAINDEDVDGRHNWIRDMKMSPTSCGDNNKELTAGVQVPNIDVCSHSVHTSTTGVHSIEALTNKTRVQFTNEENIRLRSCSEGQSLHKVSVAAHNLRGGYKGKGVDEVSQQLPLDLCQGDKCNSDEGSRQQLLNMDQYMSNKQIHTRFSAWKSDNHGRGDPVSLASGHLDWLWCEEPEGHEPVLGLHNEHRPSMASPSFTSMAARSNGSAEEMGSICVDEVLRPHENRLKVTGRHNRKSPGNEAGLPVSEAWASIPEMDSARCSSMSLTDLVETSPKNCLLRDLVHQERSTLASHLQLAGSSLGTQFCSKERDTGTMWPFYPGHSSLSTSSPLRRDGDGSSRCLSVCKPNPHGNTHGLLHCTLRAGLPNYTFLLDDYDEVVIAKIWTDDIVLGEDQGAWRYTFYSLKADGKKKSKRGWKHWKKEQQLGSELVGKMKVSSVVCSEAGFVGGSCVSVESEFILYSARAHELSGHAQADFSSQTSSSSLETPSNSCSKGSDTLPNTSSSPSQSRASSSDGGYSDVPSSGAISSWYVSQSLIPTSLGSPDRVRQRSRKWSLHSGISPILGSKAKKRSQQFTDVVVPGLYTEELSTEVTQPHSELAAMIINVPLELHDRLSGSMPTKVLDNTHTRVQPGELGNRTSHGAMEPEIHRVVDHSDDIKRIRQEQNQHADITVILPTGSHGRPSSDSKGPSPLIKRWKEGGKCDCKGWDLGCGLLVLNNQQPAVQEMNIKPSEGRGHQGQSKPLNLYRQDTYFEEAYLSLAPQENGLIAVDFQAPLSPLQALAMAVAILHGRSGVPNMESSLSIPPVANLEAHAQRKGLDGDLHGVEHNGDPGFAMGKRDEGKGVASGDVRVSMCSSKGVASPINGSRVGPHKKAQVSDVLSCASELALSFERV